MYVKEADINRDVLEEKSIEEIAGETKEEILEVVTPEVKKETPKETTVGTKARAKKEVEIFDRVETIRIVGPGSYELNIDKMAKSDRADRECRERRGQLHHRSHGPWQKTSQRRSPKDGKYSLATGPLPFFCCCFSGFVTGGGSFGVFALENHFHSTTYFLRG